MAVRRINVRRPTGITDPRSDFQARRQRAWNSIGALERIAGFRLVRNERRR